MSMDLWVYAACAISFPDQLPEPEIWTNYGGSDWAYEQPTWQVVVDDESEAGIPDEALELLPEATVAVSLGLEPIGADETAYEFLYRVADVIASSCGRAVVQGPQGLRLVPSSSEAQDA